MRGQGQGGLARLRCPQQPTVLAVLAQHHAADQRRNRPAPAAQMLPDGVALRRLPFAQLRRGLPGSADLPVPLGLVLEERLESIRIGKGNAVSVIGRSGLPKCCAQCSRRLAEAFPDLRSKHSEPILHPAQGEARAHMAGRDRPGCLEARDDAGAGPMRSVGPSGRLHDLMHLLPAADPVERRRDQLQPIGTMAQMQWPEARAALMAAHRGGLPPAAQNRKHVRPIEGLAQDRNSLRPLPDPVPLGLRPRRDRHLWVVRS